MNKRGCVRTSFWAEARNGESTRLISPSFGSCTGRKGTRKTANGTPWYKYFGLPAQRTRFARKVEIPIIPQAHCRSPVRSNIADGAQASHFVGRATSGGFGGTHISLISCYEQSRYTMYPRGDRALKGTDWWGTIKAFKLMWLRHCCRSSEALGTAINHLCCWDEVGQHTTRILLVMGSQRAKEHRRAARNTSRCGVSQPIRYTCMKFSTPFAFPNLFTPSHSNSVTFILP